MNCFQTYNSPNELQERASLLQGKENLRYEDVENLINVVLSEEKVETTKHLELATALDLKECTLEIGSILKAFREKSEIEKLSSEEKIMLLAKALRLVQLPDLAYKISNRHEEEQGQSINFTLSNIFLFEKTKTWFPWILAAILCLTLIGTQVFHKEYGGQDESKLDTLGLVGIYGKKAQWIKSCIMNSNYTGSLDSFDRSITLYGVAQVEDEIWLCGGQTDNRNIEQSKSCQTLSLVDGKWRPLDQKMNLHRIRPVMFVADRKVIVRGGSTSDVNIESGCRKTQEVFDLDNPRLGWQKEDIDENYSCHSSSQIITINC